MSEIADMEIREWTKGDCEQPHFHSEHDEVIWIIEGRLTIITHMDSARGGVMEVKQQLYASSRPVMINHMVSHSIEAATDCESIHVRKAMNEKRQLMYDDTHELTELRGGADEQ